MKFLTGPQSQYVEEENKPAIVLDETCVNQQDYSTSLMGKVKEFSSLTNLKVVLANKGFDNIKLKYMGGFWVMIEFQTEASKEKFKAKVGIGSWFSQLEQASNLFHIYERVTWVDIEGIPLKDDGYFNSKRLCIKTKLVENIFESFKIITQGKVLWVRAKDVFGWIPDFVEDDEEESDSDDEIREGELHDEGAGMHNHATVEGESDVEDVSETIFENEQYQALKKDDLNVGQNDIRLEDPFNIYDLLNKKQDNIIGGSSSDNMKYPLGFTLTNIHDEKVDSKAKKTCPLSNPKDDKEESICLGHLKKSKLPRLGGSMLQLMDDLVKMNFMSLNIPGLAQKAKKDWVKELCVNNKVNFMYLQETKMEIIELFNIKMCWGNFALDYVYSSSIGYSSGDALLHYDAEMELMNLILLSIPNDIYNSVDACTSAKDILQPEWLKYVTQVRLAKRLTVDTFDDLFDYLQQFEKLVNVSKANKLEKSHEPLALVAHTGSSSRNISSYYVTHPTFVVDYEYEYQQDDVHNNSEDPLTSAMLPEICLIARLQPADNILMLWAKLLFWHLRRLRDTLADDSKVNRKCTKMNDPLAVANKTELSSGY
ncbi:RNA-directed DNA polymerase, eukaryota, reverse transcriptase zinc-binding domain protein [Tanacetum coccineum]